MQIVSQEKYQQLPIKISEDKIADFCQRNHISKLSLFGSVLRSDFRPDSDVDVLVEFMPGQKNRFADSKYGNRTNRNVRTESRFANPRRVKPLFPGKSC
jgi:hypothetical protein